MKIGICPTKYGYSAICLPPYHSKKWELYSPVSLPEDLKIQLRAQILHRLAQYCYDLSPWVRILWLAVPWALWGLAALFLSSLFKPELLKYAILYGWIRILFFADGIWTLTQTLVHGPGLLRAAKIRKKAALGEWKFIQAEWPTHRPPFETETEREYLKDYTQRYPKVKPYIKEMLRTEPPLAFSAWPLGAFGFIKSLFLGAWIAKPILIFELGMLQC